jgi:hypothetical protein
VSRRENQVLVLSFHNGNGDVLPLTCLGLWQAMEKLKDMEASMIRYFEEHRNAAGTGLGVLPGVVDLLRTLKAGTQTQTTGCCSYQNETIHGATGVFSGCILVSICWIR